MKRGIGFYILFSLLISVIVINSCKKDPVIPTLTTANATNIIINSLTSGGNITKNGGAEVTARGVCYGTSANPDISGLHTSDNSGSGRFVSIVTGLTPNTLYHIRAYATNSAGTAYGNEVTATTTAIVAPILTTAGITSISLTSAVSGGNITSDGNDAVTARGVCWATTANPAINDFKTTDGTGTGAFTSNLTGLTPGTTYYVRAYATNSVGTAYGNEISFTTSAGGVPTLTTTNVTSINMTSAVSGGNITADGGGSVTARGICWATSTGPTLANSKTTDGTGTGAFTSNLTGLTPGSTYYVRAYATNSAGTAYGNEFSFTATSVQLPTLTTAGITSITLTSAVSGGNITADGGGPVTARGICWAAATSPTIANSKTTDGTGTGAFTSNLAGLTAGSTYYVRAYATNSAGTAYGNELSFTATSVQLPTLTTAGITSITLTSAVSGGNITADGGRPVTARGICWATATSPTIANSKTTDGTGTGSFTSNLTGLTPGSTYYVRAYATNSAGTAYGNELSFTATSVQLPTISTTQVTNIGFTNATSGGNITSDGGGAVTSSGICWSTTTNPTTSDSKTTNGTATGSFTSNLTGLSPGGATYYVRAYATNSSGTAYGNQLIFNTNLADVDGNSYKTVTIGTQVWMAENLKTTKYNDGTPIPNVTDNTTWSALTTGAYCDYSNTPTYSTTYGKLYNWYAVGSTNIKNVCPAGWHVPTDAQLTSLVTYLGGESLAGGKLKETGTTHWLTPNTGATNETDFTALPGGYRNTSGTFGLMGNTGYWWSSADETPTYSWYYYIYYGNGSITRLDHEKHYGSSVRCLKD